MEDRTINFIYALVVGTSIRGNITRSNIWGYEPGVRFYVSIILDNMNDRLFLESLMNKLK